MLDKLVKLYSISGALLIFCGVLKLSIFYSHFSIDIIEFLSFSEIITSFLDDINILVAFGIIMLVISFVVFSYVDKKATAPRENFLWNFLFEHKMKFAKGFAFAIIFLLWLTRFKVIETSYFIIYAITFCSIQMFSYIFMIKDDAGEVTFSDRKIGGSVAISFGLIIYLLAQHDIEQTVNNRRKVKIVTNDSVTYYCGTSKNIFLGKTDNYIFISSDSLKSTLILPSSEIKQYLFFK
jgi:hypothetical protein